MGIGNPGESHQWDRHNAGKVALISAIQTFGCIPPQEDGEEVRCIVGQAEVAVLLSPAWMNMSGAAVRRQLQQLRVPPAYLVVWHDDVDLALGMVRISWAARSGGHHGIESIERSLGTRRWWRVRIGIAPLKEGVPAKPPKEELASWLLSSASPSERQRYMEGGRVAARYLAAVFHAGKPLQPATLTVSVHEG